jgi:FdhD protein
MDDRKKIKLLRIDSGRTERADDVVVVEDTLTIRIDGVELVSLLYTPPMVRELTVGYLLSEGYIAGMDDVASVMVEGGIADVMLVQPVTSMSGGKVRVLTSGCGGGITFTYPKGIKDIKPLAQKGSFKVEEIIEACAEFRNGSVLFEATGGVHSAALYKDGRQAAFAEDIGRHNAVDKVFGICLTNGVNTAGAMLLTTGRVSSEILIKCLKRGVSLVVSRGAPTSLAVELASRFNVTLVGFARGRRMNVYTHDERISV